jgi:hypothetical protein
MRGELMMFGTDTTRCGSSIRVCLLLVLVSMWGAPGQAHLDSTPIAWSSFCSSDPLVCGSAVTYGASNDPLRDYQKVTGANGDDPSNGGASVGADGDISSGVELDRSINYCNPQVDAIHTNCGPESSVFWAYYEGVPTTDDDDVIFMRMRVDESPRKNATQFKNGHWNFLVDIGPYGDGDAFKEYWFDLWGNEERLRILFENNPANDVTNDDDADLGCTPAGTGGTVIEKFSTCPDYNPVPAGCANSHARAVEIGDGTGDWYIDVQVPVVAMRDNTGCGWDNTQPTYVPGSLVGVTGPVGLGLIFSTSDSSTDPLQKDTITSDISNPVPVTLSSFEARPTATGTRISWSTATATANLGFDLFAIDASGPVRLNPSLIRAEGFDSMEPRSYSYLADGVFAERFAIADVDVTGKATFHGPFAAGQAHGRPSRADLIDWQQVREEHGARAAQRHAAVEAGDKGLGVGWGTSVPWYELKVDEPGIHRVSHDQLAEAGVDLSGRPASRIALTHRGAPVPIRVETGGSAVFGPGSFIEFIAEAVDSLYTRTNVYRLHLNPSLARRVHVDGRPVPATGAAEFFIDEVRTDDDNAYSPSSATDDPWYNTYWLSRGNPVSETFVLDADDLVDGVGQASLEVLLWGLTVMRDDPDHHVVVELNGVQLADQWFDGRTELRLSATIPPGVLRPGANEVRFLLPGDTGAAFDAVVLDWYGLRYPRKFVAHHGRLEFEASADAFEVHGVAAETAVAYRVDGDQVTRLDRLEPVGRGDGIRFRGAAHRPGRYLVSEQSALGTPEVVVTAKPGGLLAGWAPYLIISHPDFISGVDPLVRARQAQGFGVKVVDLEHIYATHGHGIVDPWAVRDYIALAAEHLGTEYVLLVGGDTYDYFDNLDLGSMSFVPTVYARTSDKIGFAPADALLADVDGDGVQDLAIGRFPVRTASELQAVITKTLQFPGVGDSRTAVFAADDREPGADFSALARDLSSQLSDGWHVDEAFIDDHGADGARSVLIEAVNSGVALTAFFGHSGPEHWTFDNLFDVDDAASLVNDGHPTLVSQWGCWSNWFVAPRRNTLGHAFLVGGDHGAAAVLGSSTLTEVESDILIGIPVMQQLVEPGRTIGSAVLEAKRQLAGERPDLLDVIIGWTILGDPALMLEP